MAPTIRDCIRWINQLQEGCTIWDTDYKFIERITGALELLADTAELTDAPDEQELARIIVEDRRGE